MTTILQGRLALTVAVALIAGCAGGPTAAPASSPEAGQTMPIDTSTPITVPGLAISAVVRVPADPAEAALAAAALNDFGLELLRAGTSGDENAVLSPASIVLALAMARAGARGDTAAEMDRVMRQVGSDEHAGWLNALDAALAERTGTFPDRTGKDADVMLRIANAAYAQAGFPWEAEYLDALASRFGIGVRLVDYVRDAEAARRQINGWVSERTEERIPELLPEGVLDELTRLVLVNAIYLKAAWIAPFEKVATAPRPFRLLDGSAVNVPTMGQTSAYRYAQGDGWRAIELPYVGDSLAMTIVVPDDLAAFEGALDGAVFGEVVAALEDQRVELWLPRFGIESKLDLGGILAGLGMPSAFDPDAADFSGMAPVDELHITAVIHQANIDVDEEGTEAAAATAVVMGVTSMPPEPIVLKVDRPFLFALRDVPTGAILFLGRVVEPVERG